MQENRNSNTRKRFAFRAYFSHQISQINLNQTLLSSKFNKANYKPNALWFENFAASNCNCKKYILKYVNISFKMRNGTIKSFRGELVGNFFISKVLKCFAV